MLCEPWQARPAGNPLDVMSWQMDSEPQPAVGQPIREDNQAPPTAPPQDRSTGRPAHTPRGARSGDHPGRPGALPPAPGRLLHVLTHPLASLRDSPLTPLPLALVLALVSWQVAVGGPLLGLDRWVRHWVGQSHDALHSGLLNWLGQLFSDLGSTVPAIPVLLGAGALAAWRARRAGIRRWWLPLLLAPLAALLIPLLVVPAKAYFARGGPLGQPVAPGSWGWYPSGHTTTACVGYGVGGLLIGRTLPRAGRRPLYAAMALLGLAVGLGLVWCTYHWFLDVLAGWCLSALVLWALARWLPLTDRQY
ncbi:membrane-associated phospholipid phosphatase [Kitasatospora sp. GAS204A]|nr:membrane-associated phospholipid phosphatase [Kitasatospora sp. GAS204B]